MSPFPIGKREFPGRGLAYTFSYASGFPQFPRASEFEIDRKIPYIRMGVYLEKTDGKK